jgi:hypothetical protein
VKVPFAKNWIDELAFVFIVLIPAGCFFAGAALVGLMWWTVG